MLPSHADNLNVNHIIMYVMSGFKSMVNCTHLKFYALYNFGIPLVIM